MKLVTVLIKPFKLEEVREALSDLCRLTVTEVRGFGRQPDNGFTGVLNTSWTSCLR